MRAPLVVATDLDRRDTALDREAAGVIRQLVAKLAGKSRSLPHHNRMWGLIRAAWKHWPSTHEIQCGSPEGLKQYLQLKAGFTTPHKIVRGDTTYIWFENRSIAFEKMSQDEFNLFAEKAEQIIEDVIGVPAEKLLIMDRAEV